AVADLQRARADGRGAAVGVAAAERKGAGAGLGQSAAPGDDTAEGRRGAVAGAEIVGEIDGAGAGQRANLQVRGRTQQGVREALGGAAGERDVGEEAVAAASLVVGDDDPVQAGAEVDRAAPRGGRLVEVVVDDDVAVDEQHAAVVTAGVERVGA